MLVLAEEFQHSFWLATVSWSMAQAATCLGDWESARQHSESGLELFPNDCRNLAVRMQVAAELGEFNQGKRYMENLVSSVRMSPRGPTFEYMVAALGIPLFDRIAGGADQLDAAQDAADAILSADNSSTVLRWGAMAGSALSSIREGDRSASADHYKSLLSGRGTVTVAVSLVLDRLLGLLAQSFGDLSLASEHFEDAMTFCSNAGYRPELAWTCCDYADALIELDGKGDRAKAVALLEESLAISTELGMRPLTERVQIRLNNLSA